MNGVQNNEQDEAEEQIELRDPTPKDCDCSNSGVVPMSALCSDCQIIADMHTLDQWRIPDDPLGYVNTDWYSDALQYHSNDFEMETTDLSVVMPVDRLASDVRPIHD